MHCLLVGLSHDKDKRLRKNLCQYVYIYHILPKDYGLCVSTVYPSKKGHFPKVFT